MDVERFAASFLDQAEVCASHGSPMYAALLRRAADDVRARGPVARLVSGFRGDPRRDAFPLRLLGSVHARVLAGGAPELARFYPSTGGAWEPQAGSRAWLALVDARADELRPELDRPVQTNEVGRCAALLGGFLEIARRARVPVALLELGASAGLNLRFDRYRYELGDWSWGEPAASVALRARWRGPIPRRIPVRVASRRGCDLAPIDPRDPAARLRLESFVWADQTERFAALRTALEVARADALEVERAGAASWLEHALAERPKDAATVVFHSVVWPYLPAAEQRALRALLERAGKDADAAAPLAWLRMEGVELAHAELRLRLWPDGAEQLLAHAHYHGSWIEWLAGSS